MSDAGEPKFTKEEFLKEGSHQLRGTVAQELAEGTDCFIEDNAKVLKFHGTYQQDDKDHRKDKNADGTRKGKAYMFMVRTRIPGGKVTAEQLLAELDLCDNYGNGTLRITSRQGFQLHGVVKQNLRETIRGINRTMLTTLAACGDVERNVMCCPPRTTAIPSGARCRRWRTASPSISSPARPGITKFGSRTTRETNSMRRSSNRSRSRFTGPVTFPRKFKTAFALPEDNCVEIYSNDLGFLRDRREQYHRRLQRLVGGGMGVTPERHKTFPAVAKRMTYVTPDQVFDVAEVIVKVQRDFGNREDRKVARMKYLIANWGIPKFKEKVEEYYGRSLPEPHPIDVTEIDDHIGWHDQGDGKLFLGINIENGRIKDEGDLRIKTGLRQVVGKYGMRCRTTPLQSLILCDIDPSERRTSSGC